MKMLNVIKRINEHQVRPYLAPIPIGGNRVDVFTIQDTIPYWFSVNSNAGWFWFDKHDHTNRQARVGEVYDYEEQLPRFYVIALYPVHKVEGEHFQQWLCVPYHLADAEQRGWKNGEPRILYLVGHNIRPLQAVVARDLAGVLLYDRVDTRLNANFFSHEYADWLYGDTKVENLAISRDWQHAVTIARERVEAIRVERERREAEAHAKTLEGRMELALSASGAELAGYTEMLDGYKIRWSYKDREFEMDFDKNLRLESAGICMVDHSYGGTAGGDTAKWHSLSTIVDVMREARELDEDD
jgi:hypothetical protein